MRWVDRVKRCPHCRGLVPYPLTRCRRRTCPGYAPLWAGDQRRKLFVNLQWYATHQPADVKEARVLLGAVTAPGSDQLPWDEKHCAVLGEHEHSGWLGCRVQREAAERWNESAPARWRDLHRAVYTRCRREGLRPWLLVRTWEMQHRGVLHVHPVLAYSTAAEKRAARRYLEHLAELAPRYGFGYTERKVKAMPAQAAAAYLSAYFVRGRKGKVALYESVTHPEMPRSIVHVSARLTQATGCTMRRLRLKRWLFVRWGRNPLPRGESWHLLDRLAEIERERLRPNFGRAP